MRAWADATAKKPRNWLTMLFVGRAVGPYYVLTASAYALGAAGYALPRADDHANVGNSWVQTICVLGVALAWLLAQTTFTAQYAYRYHRDGGARARLP